VGEVEKILAESAIEKKPQRGEAAGVAKSAERFAKPISRPESGSVDSASRTPEVVKVCSSCDEPLASARGKWACPNQSCGMYGVEVKPK
jgi:hypothetical protein